MLYADRILYQKGLVIDLIHFEINKNFVKGLFESLAHFRCDLPCAQNSTGEERRATPVVHVLGS